jgi:2-keto-3-deoxy-L-rhamnonate aldolase RhmA
LILSGADGRRTVKQRLNAGDQLLGCFLGSASPLVTEVMALAGFDCVMIDGEHSAVGLETAQIMTMAARGVACDPLMRVSQNDTAEIKRALDIGLDGLMAPAVNSRAEAEALVRACRYPPDGIRGVAVRLVRAASYGLDAERYAKEANDALLVIAQIETMKAVEAVEAIASTPGVDMLFIGPSDLSASMGHIGKPDHPEVQKAIRAVEAAVKRAGKWLGIVPTAGRPADSLFADGYHLVLGAADITLLREAAVAHVGRFKPKGTGRR